jgi:methylated-DNA-[protein]-cysteine S-methyltransferase
VLTLILFDTVMGYIGLLGSERGLRRVILPQETQKEVFKIAVIDHVFTCDNNSTCLGDLPLRLNMYFEGKEVKFDDRIDIVGATRYQKTIWNLVRKIPYGTTISYRQLAQQAGNDKAARAAGNALARNPVPVVIPCHRVIAGNNKLGGFSGGLKLKKYLLELESAHFA